MNVTINRHVVVAEPSTEMVQATAALLSPKDKDLQIPLRDRILAFEKLAKGEPQLNVPTSHEFIDGMYRRQVIFPKGFLGTGQVHLKPHFDVMLKGEMLVATEDGIKHLKAPCQLITLPGKKKFGYALKETIWVTFHPTSCTTVEAVEKEIMCMDWDGYELEGELVVSTFEEKARADFQLMCLELGVTAETVKAQSENTSDLALDVPIPSARKAKSTIQGKGMFATSSVTQGFLWEARTAEGKRTKMGRFVNHSHSPNSRMCVRGERILLMAIKPIAHGEEITCDYRESVKAARSMACQE